MIYLQLAALVAVALIVAKVICALFRGGRMPDIASPTTAEQRKTTFDLVDRYPERIAREGCIGVDQVTPEERRRALRLR